MKLLVLGQTLTKTLLKQSIKSISVPDCFITSKESFLSTGSEARQSQHRSLYRLDHQQRRVSVTSDHTSPLASRAAGLRAQVGRVVTKNPILAKYRVAIARPDRATCATVTLDDAFAVQVQHRLSQSPRNLISI